MHKSKSDLAFSALYLAQALEGEVEAWADQGWHGISQTTHTLFNYWFLRDDTMGERFHPCQRRAIETVVYCHEILRAATLGALFERVAPEALNSHLPLKQEVEAVPFPKYGIKMATGSGKTWVLIALIVWQYFNRLNAEKGPYSYRFLVVAPGHEVLNRLLDSFKGKRDPVSKSRLPTLSDFARTLFVPEGANWRDRFHLEVLEPRDVRTNASPPDGPFAFITNWQQFQLRTDTSDLWAQYTGEDVQDMPRGEVILEFLSQYPDLMVMNDEAHHVHGKVGSKGDELVWRKFMRLLQDRLHSNHKKVGAFIQVDYSATPFFGSGEKREYFPHIVYDYDLVSAMRDMLVKQIFLEERQQIAGESPNDLDFRAERHEPETGRKRGQIKALSPGQKLLIDIGRLKLEQLAREFEHKHIDKKPVMMVLCENTEVADLALDHFATLTDERGNSYNSEQAMVIHSQLSNSQLEAARDRLDRIDVDDDPLRVIISVLMLREGFDKTNICITVVLRATDADLLLEQIVGRGLRLMFPPYTFPELQDSKYEAFQDIRQNKVPSNSLDFLFIVEHPRFRQFYDRLREEGFVIGGGDTSTTVSTGDLYPVDAIVDRVHSFDLTWPIQVFDAGRLPDLWQIEIDELPRYDGDFNQLKQFLSKLVIQERHVESGKKTKTWKMQNDYFDYSHFLRQASRAIVTSSGTPVLTAAQAKIMEIVDDYVSYRCFGIFVDFAEPENYQVLNYALVFDHIVNTVQRAVLKLLQGFKYEPKGAWARLSDVPRIMVRFTKSVETAKSIYSRLGYQVHGGGFERDFMMGVLNDSAEVVSYAKLTRRHKLKISYRDHTGILREYEVDFIVKTADSMYLVETKSDRDIRNPNVAVKCRAAVAWCEQASTLTPPSEFAQPQRWEYLLISEGVFYSHIGLGFDALVPLCRALRDNVIAQAESRLFI